MSSLTGNVHGQRKMPASKSAQGNARPSNVCPCVAACGSRAHRRCCMCRGDTGAGCAADRTVVSPSGQELDQVRWALVRWGVKGKCGLNSARLWQMCPCVAACGSRAHRRCCMCRGDVGAGCAADRTVVAPPGQELDQVRWALMRWGVV